MQESLKFNRRLIAATVFGVFAAALAFRAGVSLLDAADRRAAGPNVAMTPVETPEVKRAVIISVDGLRPDLLLRSRAPHIRSLMERGSFSMWARTTEVSITLPSHTSMVTGVRPEYHAIHWNSYIKNVYPDVPTLFELAQEEGYTTAIAAGKSKFHELARPASVDWAEIYKDKSGNNLDVGHSAADIIRRHRPDVMLIHLPDVDVAGHSKGWGTPPQMEAIERADAAVGLVLDALAEKGLLSTTLIILSADHGGAGTGHGANDPRSRHIPWIAMGPGIRRNFDLTKFGKLVINTEDTFATAAGMLNIPVPHRVDGRFVEEILDRDELLQTTSTSASSSSSSSSAKKPAAKKLAPGERRDPPSYKWQRQEVPSHH